VFKRVAVVFLVIVLALAVTAEIVLPAVVSRGVRNALASSGFGRPDQFQVRLKSFPSVRMLLGHFDKVTVISTNVATSTLVLSELSVTLEDAAVDMRALLADKSLKVDRSGGGQVSITITADSLKAYLAKNVPDLKDPAVTITPEATTLAGRLGVAGVEIRISLTGTFVLAGPSRVAFTISGCRVNEVAVPAEFLETWLAVLKGPDLSLDLARFPLPLEGKEVIQEDGRVIIKGLVGTGG